MNDQIVWHTEYKIHLRSDLRVYCPTSEFSVRPQNLASDLRIVTEVKIVEELKTVKEVKIVKEVKLVKEVEKVKEVKMVKKNYLKW